MWQQIILVLLPFACGVIAGVVVAYPRGYRFGYERAKKMLLPGMVQEAVLETLGVGEAKDGDENQTPG